MNADDLDGARDLPYSLLNKSDVFNPKRLERVGARFSASQRVPSRAGLRAARQLVVFVSYSAINSRTQIFRNLTG